MAQIEDVQRLMKFLDSILDTEEYNAVSEMLADCIDIDDDVPAEDKAGKINYIAKLPTIGILADRRRRIGADSKMIDRETIRELQEIRAAEAETGVTMGLDSAPAVYREAIRRMGRDPAGLTGNAARATYRVLRSAPRGRAAVAMDGRAVASRGERFPNGDRLLKSTY